MAAPMTLTCVRPCQMGFCVLRQKCSLFRHCNAQLFTRNCSDYSKAKAASERSIKRQLSLFALQLVGASTLGGLVGYTIKKKYLKPNEKTDDIVKPPRIHQIYQPVSAIFLLEIHLNK